MIKVIDRIEHLLPYPGPTMFLFSNGSVNYLTFQISFLRDNQFEGSAHDLPDFFLQLLRKKWYKKFKKEHVVTTCLKFHNS